jgi:hypothetical protein
MSKIFKVRVSHRLFRDRVTTHYTESEEEKDRIVSDEAVRSFNTYIDVDEAEVEWKTSTSS